MTVLLMIVLLRRRGRELDVRYILVIGVVFCVHGLVRGGLMSVRVLVARVVGVMGGQKLLHVVFVCVGVFMKSKINKLFIITTVAGSNQCLSVCCFCLRLCSRYYNISGWGVYSYTGTCCGCAGWLDAMCTICATRHETKNQK